MRRIVITESQLRLITEIEAIARNSNVTVCSLGEFKKLVSSLGINDSNVDDYIGKYCFIEVGSSWGRLEAEVPIMPPEFDDSGNEYSPRDFYTKGQWYFNSEHRNVLKLEFDDNQTFNNRKGGTMTAVILKPSETRNGQKGTRFYFRDGKDFTPDLAKRLKKFTDGNLSANPDTRFIIHCKQGQSRSAAIGIYIARKIGQLSNEFLSEYDNEERNQFNIGVGRKGEPKYPHQNVMNRMGDIEGWNREQDSPKYQWWYDTIRNHPRTGYNDKRREWEIEHNKN